MTHQATSFKLPAGLEISDEPIEDEYSSEAEAEAEANGIGGGNLGASHGGM